MDQLVEGFEQAGLGVEFKDLSPPPGARRRSDGSMPALTSPSALITVLRLIPEAGHCRLATATQRFGHCTGHDASLHLVQMGQYYLEESRELISTDLHRTRLHRAY